MAIKEYPTIILGSAPPPPPAAPVVPADPPPLYFSPNLIEDNRQRALRGLPIVKRGYWPGDAKIGLGPTGERLEVEQARRAAEKDSR